MDLGTFIIAVSCWIDATLPGVMGSRRMRQRARERRVATGVRLD